MGNMLSFSSYVYLAILKKNWRHVKPIQGNIRQQCSNQLHHCWENIYSGSKLCQYNTMMYLSANILLHAPQCQYTSVAFPG